MELLLSDRLHHVHAAGHQFELIKHDLHISDFFCNVIYIVSTIPPSKRAFHTVILLKIITARSHSTLCISLAVTKERLVTSDLHSPPLPAVFGLITLARDDTGHLDPAPSSEMPADKLSFLIPRNAVDEIGFISRVRSIDFDGERAAGFLVAGVPEFRISDQTTTDCDDIHRVAPLVIVILKFQIVPTISDDKVTHTASGTHHVLNLPKLPESQPGFLASMS